METRLVRRILAGCAATLLIAAGLGAQDKLNPGTYKGQWAGASASGEIHMTFRPAADGGLTPEVGFTLGDQEVNAKVVSFKTEGAKITIVYEFDAQGNTLKSAAEGLVKGKTIEGTYKTTAADQAIDAGTWKVTAP
jgi:hypothetical protein